MFVFAVENCGGDQEEENKKKSENNKTKTKQNKQIAGTFPSPPFAFVEKKKRNENAVVDLICFVFGGMMKCTTATEC